MDNGYNEKLEHVSSLANLKFILKERKKMFYEKTIQKEEREQALSQGYEVIKENKKTLRVIQQKSAGDIFEDEVWTLFADMEFLYLNDERHCFKLPGMTSESKKQIDVFAIDEDVVVIAECKAAEKESTKKDFRGDICEIDIYRNNVTKYLNSFFTTKPKYIFMFCTSNYVLPESNLELMKVKNIQYFDKKKILYYKELTKQLGVLAKYQFFGEILEGQKVPGLSDIRVPAIKTKLGGKECYSMMIEPQKLLKIGYVLHRSDTSSKVNTYQRYVQKSRIEDIGRYINEGGFFPNSVIVNFNDVGNEKIRFDDAPKSAQSNDKCTLGSLYLPAKFKSAFIIDGQHRLYGFAKSDKKDCSVIPVIAFNHLDPSVQSQIFVNINSKGKAVKRDLILSLNSELYWDSPNRKEALHALNSMVAIKLSETMNSPLYNCILLENSQTKKKLPTLSYFVDKALNDEKYFVTEWKRDSPLIFGPFYDSDLADKSLDRAVYVLSWFFGEIKERCNEQWESLLTNVGIATLSFMLHDFFDENDCTELIRANKKELIDMVKPRVDILCKELAKKTSEDIQRYTKVLGYGIKDAHRHFERLIYDVDNSFAPDGLKEWIIEQSGKWSENTKAILDSLIPNVIELTDRILHVNYGNEFERELPPEIYMAMYNRKKANPGRECYLEIKDIRPIALNDWAGLFQKYFSDKSMNSGDKNQKTEYLSTLTKVQESISKGIPVTEEQYNEIDRINTWLEVAINNANEELDSSNN